MRTRTCIRTKALILALALVLVLAPRGWADSGTWTVDGNGNWNVNGNWTGASYPDGAGQTAAITNNITTNVTITLNVPVTLGTLLMQDPGSSFFNVTLTNATAADTITLDNTGSTAVVSSPFGLGSDTAARYCYPDLILKSDMNIAVKAYGGFYLYGSISESGGVRNVTLDGTYSTGNGPRLYGTNSSYTGRTTVKRYKNYFGTIGNVGGGNSSLGAPTTVENGTIDIGDGASSVSFLCTGAENSRTDRILNFVGTTGDVGIGGGGGASVLTFTSPFQFSGVGAKNLTLQALAVLRDMNKTDLAVRASTSGSGYDAKGIYLLGLNNYTNKTSVYRTALVINSLSSVANPQPSSLGAPTTVANGTIEMSVGDTITGCALKYIGIGHTSDRVVNMAGTTTAGLTLNASGYGRFTLTSPLTTAAGSGPKTLTLDGTGEGELQGAIPDGSGGATTLSKTGSGTWTLKGDSTFGGFISALNHTGRLILGHPNALGANTVSLLTLTAGTLDPGDAVRTIANPVSLNTAHTIAGSNSLTFAGTVTGLYNSVGSRLTCSLDSGNTLNLTNVVITRAGAAAPMTLDGTGDTTFNGVISESGGGANSLRLLNSGVTTLKGTNSYSGPTVIGGGGTVILDYDAGGGSKFYDTNTVYLGSVPGSGVTLGGGDLVLKGGSHTEAVGSVDAGSGMRGHFNIRRESGTSVLQMNTINLGTSYGSMNFEQEDIATCDNANKNGILVDATYGGPCTVAGTNWAYNSNEAGDGLIKAYTAYTTMPLQGGGSGAMTNFVLSGSADLTGNLYPFTLKIVGSGTLNIGAFNLFQSSSLSRGILYAGMPGETYTITANGGAGVIFAGATYNFLYYVNGGELILDGLIKGRPVKAGRGRLTLNAASILASEGAQIGEGALQLRHSYAVSNSPINVCASPYGAALELNVDTNGAAISTPAATALAILGAGITNSGALRNMAGDNTYGGAIAIGNAQSGLGIGARINSDSGTLTIGGGVTTASGRDVAFGGAGQITVTNGVISGAGAVNKDGGGTLTLASANTYTGPTTVNAGTLKVTGSIAAGSMVTVNTNATLSGNGRCYGEVRVKAGGTIKPEGGNLTVSNLVLYAGCMVYREAGTANRVVVSQAGDLVFQRGLTIIGGGVYLDGRMPAGTHTVIDYSGDLNGSVTNLAVLNPEPGARYEFVDTGTAVAVKVERTLGTMLLVK